VERVRASLQQARHNRVHQAQLPVEHKKAQGNAAYKVKEYERAMQHYEASLAAAEEPNQYAQEAYLQVFKAEVEGNFSQALLMLKLFAEAQVLAEASLALAEPGSNVHNKSRNRLAKASLPLNTALAKTRLTCAKAMHERLDDKSPLIHVVERELFQTIEFQDPFVRRSNRHRAASSPPPPKRRRSTSHPPSARCARRRACFSQSRSSPWPWRQRRTSTGLNR